MDDAAVFSGAIEEGTISKIQKDSIGMEVDITRGTWKENF